MYRFHLLAATALISLCFGMSASRNASLSAADGPSEAKVSGTIQLGGKPLREGRVFFHLKDGQFVGSKLKEGKYAVDRVPVGTHVVTIEAPGVEERFQFDDKSGLLVSVKSGENTFDFNLQ